MTAMNKAAPTCPEPHDLRGCVRRKALDALFNPRSVVVIGATDRAGRVGLALIRNLQLFGGSIYGVNPNSQRVAGCTVYADIGAVPKPVDLAVIATPAPTVPAIVRECAQAGIPSAIIISAGFRETGAEGLALERACLAEARQAGMRILGPNCLGLMVPRSQLNATFADGLAEPGSVAFLSQSGALCSAVLDWSFRENAGFSAFVSVGSMIDVGWGDLLTYFGDDPSTKSIVCYMESIGDAGAFLSAAREVALTKPVIVLKVGRAEAGAKAAASHTGALTGRDAVLDAAFRRAGVLRVDTIEELFSMAELLGKQPCPSGPHLTIVTNAGGPGALATDALIAGGGRLADLTPSTMASLNDLLPKHWSHGNPIDILGDADTARYAKAVELAIQDEATDGVLAILTPQSMTDALGTANVIGSIGKKTAKPLLTSWMGGVAVNSARGVLSKAGIPGFEYPDSAARAFALMWRYRYNLQALYETPEIVPVDSEETDAPKCADSKPKAADIILPARKAGRSLLTEVEAKEILRAYDIPVAETKVAFTEEQAVELAAGLGYPVVIKLFSETLTHKTEVDGVCLDVRNATAVRHSWRQIQTAVSEKAGHRHFLGVTVQPMIIHDGYELILGSSIDPQFGPVILFGAGGRLVETLQDTAVGFPPLNTTLARRLMEMTRIFSALKKVRGGRQVDIAALEQLLVRFSCLVAEQRWIAEIDVNPLIISSRGLLALDARVLLHPSTAREEDLPRLAIRPYPTGYVTSWRLPDGTPVLIRPIRPEDEPLMIKFHQTLSDRSVYLRYFAPQKLDVRIAHERLSRVCFVDYDRDMLLVVEHHDEHSGEKEIIGVGRLSKLHGTNEAEFALTVSDLWQRRGLGLHLLKQLIQVGRDEKLERITATMLADNLEMRYVARKAGFKLKHVPGENRYDAELVL